MLEPVQTGFPCSFPIRGPNGAHQGSFLFVTLFYCIGNVKAIRIYSVGGVTMSVKAIADVPVIIFIFLCLVKPINLLLLFLYFFYFFHNVS